MIHYARNVMKTDTTSVQTFQTPNRGPAGVVHTGKIEWFEPMDRKLGNATEFSVDGLERLPRVDVIYAHANMSADLIEAAINNGAKGLVIAGVGDGNMTTPALDVLTRAAKRASWWFAALAWLRASCCATTKSTTTKRDSSRRAN